MKKRKGLWKRTLMKRIGSLVLILAMVLTMIPFSSSERAVKAADTRTIYLDTGGSTLWDQGDAWFVAYAWGDGIDANFYKMTDLNFDSIYEAKIPNGATGIIFLRKDPASSTVNDWSTYGDNGRIDQQEIGGCRFNVKGWAYGDWSDDEPVESTPVFTVAGVPELCGNGNTDCGWDPTDTSNDMTLNKDGKYEKVYENVKVSEDGYNYKVVLGHDVNWTKSWYDKINCDGDNSTVKVDVDDSTVTIIFDPETRTVSSEVVKPGENPGGDDGGDGDADTYKATFHFYNNKNWDEVALYAWTGDSNKLTGDWPGKVLTKDEEGYYTATVSLATLPETGLNFIFNNNNNGKQTADLNLPADKFDTNTKTAEVWVELTNVDGEGHYYADILDSKDEIITGSPVINDKNVTFYYRNEDAKSVQVRGSFDGWNDDAEKHTMTKNENTGIWSYTATVSEYNQYEYKFYVEYEDSTKNGYVFDPYNEQIFNDNNVFVISDPNAGDKNTVTINVYYNRTNGLYSVPNADGDETGTWNAWVWGNSIESQKCEFEKDANGQMRTQIVVDKARAAQYVSLKTRLSTTNNDWLQEEQEVSVNLSDIVSGIVNVYITSDGTNGNKGSLSVSQIPSYNVKRGNKIKDVQYNYDAGTISVTTVNPLANVNELTAVVKADTDKETGEIKYDDVNATVTGDTNSYTLTLDSGQIDLKSLYKYKVKMDDYTYDIGVDRVYASDKFEEDYTYEDDDLGATYTENSTTFKVWAPTAEAVKVQLYATGSNKEGAKILDGYDMSGGEITENGVWTATVQGDLDGKYYTYLVTVDGEEVEAVDPYARTTGVNGERGMVIDLDSTDPGKSNAFDAQDSGFNTLTEKYESYTDAIIYEMHIRDFSIDDSSGVKDEWQGKYLGLTEYGTTVDGEEGNPSTGLDYLRDLGVTHLHLLPVYDYGSVDEEKCDKFNWGYDPVNYNTPEGSYSLKPYDGYSRVAEMKEMVDVLHENEIGVIMDVVYNHVYDADDFSFNKIVPGYFSRTNSNRSGCGNDTASERAMVSKFIVDSVVYWAEEYHIDGFRFDLVGLLDVDTINKVVDEVHKVNEDAIFYGEGWDMDDTNKEPDTVMAKQGNANETKKFAYFSDDMRNLLGGKNGETLGFASGATGVEYSLVSNFMARPWWITENNENGNPTQVVQYASCHDNYTLMDKIIVSTGKGGITGDTIKMNNLAAAIYMTSQGIPLIHSGEEMLREKRDENGERCENSYNASDYVNAIRWSNLKKQTYAANSEYYAGLIAFRKAHPALSLADYNQVSSVVYNQQASNQLVSFWIDAEEAGEVDCDSIYVIFNAKNATQTVTLPKGNWDVYINDTTAGITPIEEKVSGSVKVPGISAMVLVQTETSKTPGAGDTTPKSNVALTGKFNNWNHSNWMDKTDDENVVTQTLSVSKGLYAFKIKINDGTENGAWYSSTASISDTCEDFAMSTTVGSDCTWNCEGGTYKFTYNTSTNALTVARVSTDVGAVGDPDAYYLFGYINGEDYPNGSEVSEYKFGTDGTLTTTFDSDSYVAVKKGDNSAIYWTDGYLGCVTSATLYNSNTYKTDDAKGEWKEKLLVPGGVKVKFTLKVNEDNTVTLTCEPQEDVTSKDQSGIQNGVTLHCWNWSFKEIEENMPLIASQGFTAVQTSPIQPLKEATNLSTNNVGKHWWVYYQPTDFAITDDEGNALGTKAELISMINTAHEYGVKVIVDVVSNHLANEDRGNTLSTKIPATIRENEDYWHDITWNISQWGDRYNMTQYCMDGLPDLNTGNKDIQNKVLVFLKDCVDIGVDGFRFDAAKSIETPSDNKNFASDFWPTVVKGVEDYAQEKYKKDIYVYGEILDEPAIAISAYTEYMAVTDNVWGNKLRESIASDTAAAMEGYYKATDASNLVLWAESHDTYATNNAYESSYNVSNEDIIKTWAIVASRSDAMALYLARPESMTQALGAAYVDETGWASPEVQAINNFRNQMLNSDETEVGNNGGFSYVRYGNSIVLVKAQEETASFAAVSASVRYAALAQDFAQAGKICVTVEGMEAGSYTDQITGSTFTVTDGRIEGWMDDSDIAVLYTPTNTVEVQETTGGEVSVGNTIPKTGSVVTITVTPDNGKEVDTITVKDKNGNIVAVTKKDTNVYTYTQPEGKVTINVTFKEASATPGNDKPGTDTPGTDTPGTDTPGTDTPGTDTPGTDTPGTDTPGTDTPGTDTPGTDTPGTDTPGNDTPGTDNGDVTKKPGKTEDGKYAASLGDSVDELKNVIFTEEELTEIAAGKDASVYLTIADISKKVTDAEKTLIKNEAEGYSVGIYLDLNLFKVIGDSNPQQMKELGKGITVSIMIPDSLLNTDSSIKRTYAIVRIHEGKATLLEGTFNEATKEFSFKTDKFSTYAIVYKDEAASAQNPNTQTPNGGTTLGADTGDSNGIFLYGLLAVAAMTAMAGVGFGTAKRRRRG